MLWVSGWLLVVVAVVFVGPPVWVAGTALLATLLLAVRAFVSGPSGRRRLLSFAAWLAVIGGVFTAGVGLPHVSVAARSPDGTAVAEVYETDWLVDRHVRVRVKTLWLGVIPVRRVVFHSPDEGARGGERLVWSRDGRYVLLLGPRLFGTPDGCLASGEVLYLLVDTGTWAVVSNSSRPLLPRFSLQDLAGLDFGVELRPGTYARQLHRCVSPAAS